MFGYEYAASRVDSDHRRADPSLTVAFAVAAAFPVALALATHPAFAVGALAGLVAGVAVRR
ncbi:hypothetical protein [Candidatus Halobonum tyrrellensis]|uniref:Uncharacterized protein n=1 Tax=Candidatus Halobonum tyrrellensis G22 TaxID=1324957 RepID=V4HH86_9EURY|nr:hypothetical protein [Candidatus Halobonum tyrrellensis]ESP87239.1 hypothetical protein K933_15279 [Candidatus Halobonum tyrrellensis G22]